MPKVNVEGIEKKIRVEAGSKQLQTLVNGLASENILNGRLKKVEHDITG